MKKTKTDDEALLEYRKILLDSGLFEEANKKTPTKIFLEDYSDVRRAINERASASLALRDELNSQECDFSPEFQWQMRRDTHAGGGSVAIKDIKDDPNVFRKNDEPTKESSEHVKDAKLTSEKLGIGFFTINGQEIKIGQAKNTTFKLLEALCPFGTLKAVEAVYRATTIGQSKHRVENFSLFEKKKILRSRIKELQDIFNKQKMKHKEKIKVMLDFNDEAGTVCLRQK